MTIIILAIIYILGYLLCYSMLRIQHEAEERVYTKGDRLKNILLSALSLAMVLLILVLSWIKSIQVTGYWSKPVKKETK